MFESMNLLQQTMAKHKNLRKNKDNNTRFTWKTQIGNHRREVEDISILNVKNTICEENSHVLYIEIFYEILIIIYVKTLHTSMQFQMMVR